MWFAALGDGGPALGPLVIEAKVQRSFEMALEGDSHLRSSEHGTRTVANQVGYITEPTQLPGCNRFEGGSPGALTAVDLSSAMCG
jgi:hypothetical protein